MSNRFFPNYDKYRITSRFGMRTLKGQTRMHNGIDLVAQNASGGSETDYIMAHTGGMVVGVGYNDSAGNYLKIQTAPGVVMVYYHLKDKPKFAEGDTVKTGQTIGYMGSTGNVTGAHLHWGISVNGSWIDPEPYLDKDYVTVRPTVTVTLPVIYPGDKGEHVETMQALLIGYGYNCGKEGVDGSNGPATQKALKKYQQDSELAVDGKCGPATWGSLLRQK